MCSAMLALHAFFWVRLYERIQSQGENYSQKDFGKASYVYVDVLGTFSETNGVPEGSQTELEKFACCMYGKPSNTDANKLHHDLTRQKFHR